MQSAQISIDELPCLLNTHRKVSNKLKESMSPLEQKFYQDIFDQFDDIMNQRYWYKDDLDQKDLTQSQLILIAKNIYLKSLNETYLKLLAIKKRIIDFYSPEYICTDELLKFALTSIDAVTANLKQGREAKESTGFPLQLNEDEEEYYSAYYLTQYLANQLGGSYFPHRQTDDPLALNRIIHARKGVCAGDQMDFLMRMSEKKKSIFSVRADGQTLEKQINQHNYREKHQEQLMRKNYISIADVWVITQDILVQIKKNYFYAFKFYAHEELRGHTMGFYQDSNGKILFRDSNDITVSFRNILSFRTFLFYYFCDFYKAGFSYYERYTQGEIVLGQWKSSFSSIIDVPEVKNDMTRSVELKAIEQHTTQAFDSFHSKMQIIAALPENKKIPPMIYQTFADENNSFKICLQKKFKLTVKKENKSDFVKCMDKYHQKLKNSTLKTLDQQIANIEKFQENNPISGQSQKVTGTLQLLKGIRSDVKTARVDQTLISIIDHRLGEMVAPVAVKNLVKNHEIHPGCVLILQQKLLRKLCMLCNKNWAPIMVGGEREGEESKKMPASIKKMRILLQDYYMHDMIDMPSLLRQIQLVFAEKGSSFFSRIRHMRTAAMQEFDLIMKKLDVHNPSSLQEAFLKITQFAETHLKPVLTEQPKPIVSSSPQLSAG